MKNREQVTDQYVLAVIEEMSEKERDTFIFNVLKDSYYYFTDEDMEEEVKAWHPELL